MISTPKITVLMPAYNAAQFIAVAIRSVLNQTFSDFELVIVNDGSSDNTMDIIKGFSDPRIIVVNQQHSGIADALNNGIRNARAEYIARFDADDICLPERLHIQYNFITFNPDCVIVGSDAEYVDIAGEYVFTYSPPAHEDNEIRNLDNLFCPFIHSSVLYKKTAVIEAGGYDLHALCFEDQYLWKSLLKKGKAYNLKIALLQVRLSPQSLTIDEKWRTRRFMEIKLGALKNGRITQTESFELKQIIQQQNTTKIKKGAYYSLLAKKYLWNNYQPSKARQNIKKSLMFHPADIKNYLIWMLSFLPEKAIRRIYYFSKNAT